MRRFLCQLFLFCFCFSLFAQDATEEKNEGTEQTAPKLENTRRFKMFAADDPLLEDIKFLLASAGTVPLSWTPPFSSNDIRLMLDSIDAEKLNPAAGQTLDRVYAALEIAKRSGKFFAFTAEPYAALEGRVRTNKDIEFSRKDSSAPSLAAVPISLFFSKYAELHVGPELRIDPTRYMESGKYAASNVPYKFESFDNIVFRTFAAAGGSFWNFELGRDKVSYGPGRTGNLAVSDNPDYYDFARVSLFWKPFKYSFFLAQIPLSSEDLTSVVDPDFGTMSIQRYFYMHRIDIKPIKKLTFSFNEGIIANSPVELRFLVPLALLHSFFAWNDYDTWNDGGHIVGSIFSFDFTLNIITGLNVYGQFVMNELTIPSEDDGTLNPPNETGYLAGIEHARVLGKWNAVFFTEFVYTDPYLYVLRSPFSSFIWMRRLPPAGDRSDFIYSWIGHREGRDVWLITLGAKLSKENLRLDFDATLYNRGRHSNGAHNIVWDWEKTEESSAERTPSGVAERSFVLGVNARWKLIKYVELRGYLGGIFVFNSAHTEGLNRAGAECVLTAKFTLPLGL